MAAFCPLSSLAGDYLARVDRSPKAQTQKLGETTPAPLPAMAYMPVTGPAALRFNETRQAFNRSNLLTLHSLLREANGLPDAREGLASASSGNTSPGTVGSSNTASASASQASAQDAEVEHADDTITEEPWQGPVEEEEPKRVVSSGMPNIDLSRDYVGNFQYFNPEDVLPFFEVKRKSKDQPRALIGVPFELPTQTPSVNPSRATYKQSE